MNLNSSSSPAKLSILFRRREECVQCFGILCRLKVVNDTTHTHLELVLAVLKPILVTVPDLFGSSRDVVKKLDVEVGPHFAAFNLVTKSPDLLFRGFVAAEVPANASPSVGVWLGGPQGFFL
jgi:hypothetical protein